MKEKELKTLLSETNNNEEKNENIKVKAIELTQIKINNKEKGENSLW